MPQDEPDRQVVLQRVRNRIIECLELASNFKSQREYQRVAPISVPNEVINRWEDWYDHDPSWLVMPVFTEEERAAVIGFDRVWNHVADATPPRLPVLEQTLALPAWDELRVAALEALKPFLKRGKLDEESRV